MTTELEAPARGGALVRIVDTPTNIVAAWKEFENLKQQILTAEDKQAYTVGTGANKQTKYFIKKSGWRKIGAAFGITIERISVNTQQFGEGHIAITHTVRAIAPGGRSADGVGSCDSHEERFEESVWKTGSNGKSYKEGTGVYKWKYNDVDGTAYTRAVNRAISDLVGGGEVSAEEMQDGKDVTPAVPELPQKYQDRLGQLAEISEDSYDELARLVLMEIGTKFLTVEQATRVGKQLAEKFEKKAAPSPDKKATPAPANQKPTAEDIKAKAADFEDAEVRPVEPEDEDF